MKVLLLFKVAFYPIAQADPEFTLKSTLALNSQQVSSWDSRQELPSLTPRRNLKEESPWELLKMLNGRNDLGLSRKTVLASRRETE